MSARALSVVNQCPRCREYAWVRAAVLAPALSARRVVTGETKVQIVTRYMTGVHQRHLAGLPILPGSGPC